jgi:hypothetical protein
MQDVRPELARSVLKGRVAAAKAQKVADRLQSALAAGGSFSRLVNAGHDEPLSLGSKRAKADGRPLGFETGWIRRTDTEVPRVGEAPQLIEAAFGLQEGGDTLVPMRVEDALIVVQLKVREHADLAKLAAERDELYDAVVGQKQQRVLAAWLTQLRVQAKVDLNPAFLQPALPAADEAPAAAEPADEVG